MEEFEKFLTSGQPAVKLDLALELGFSPDLSPEKREVLQAYLRQRIRPAAALLAERRDMEGLDRLESLGWLRGVDLEDCLQKAGRDRNFEAFLWLLRRKARETGFPGLDLSL